MSPPSTPNATIADELVGFYGYVEEPVAKWDETGLANYEQYLKERGKSEATVRHAIRTVRNYWAFAREQEASA